jgi:hypothetical protein
MTKDEAGKLPGGQDWLGMLNRAATAPDVVQLCVSFLSLWTSDLRSKLGENCQPPLAMRNYVDVTEYAFRLVHTRLMQNASTPELDAMATFFALAANRLSKLLATSPNAPRVPFFTQEREKE